MFSLYLTIGNEFFPPSINEPHLYYVGFGTQLMLICQF